MIVQDAAGIAMEAINYARDSKIDVVLVDTAGRMQVTQISLLFHYMSFPENSKISSS
jgi:signal recognition particle GTPase